MAITSDGTHAFGIEDSPITIDSVTYILESASYNQSASRVDINDSNGEPVGSTIVPSRIEGSATLQLAASDTAIPSLGDEFTLSGGRDDGAYILTDIGEPQSQGDYAKVAISFYMKLN